MVFPDQLFRIICVCLPSITQYYGEYNNQSLDNIGCCPSWGHNEYQCIWSSLSRYCNSLATRNKTGNNNHTRPARIEVNDLGDVGHKKAVKKK